ncbi:MAG TPA: hypothetical protein VJ724_01670, partial [Tahibacter sp.]|nr:hypothetical protein [Tahibacter sp.]
SLPSPLAAGASGDYLLRMRVPPTARGNMMLSVGATSDDDEIAPGDEVALFKAPIIAQVDLGTTVRCNAQTFANPTARVVCDFDIRNAGPSAAVTPFINFYTGYSGAGAYWTCAAPRPGLCPAGTQFSTSYGFSPASIESGETLRVRGEFLPPMAPYPTIYVYGGASSAENDPNYVDNHVQLEFDVTLFRDDFEPTSSTPTP